MIHLMIIYDVVNIFSMKNYESSRKLRVGLNWYPGVNWSTTTTGSQIFFANFVFLGRNERKTSYRFTVPTTTPNQCPNQVSTFYTLWNPRNSPDKILKLMVTMTWSKVKSRSHHDIAHLHLLTNVPTKY